MHHLYTLRNDNVESNTKAGKANYSYHTDWKKTEENYVDTHNTFLGFFQDNGTLFSSSIGCILTTPSAVASRYSGRHLFQYQLGIPATGLTLSPHFHCRSGYRWTQGMARPGLYTIRQAGTTSRSFYPGISPGRETPCGPADPWWRMAVGR